MSTQDRPTPARSHPSHHSGPGHANSAPPPDAQFDDDLTERFIQWLDYVPSSHRDAAQAFEGHTVASLEVHERTCRRHPFSALWAAHRHLESGSAEVRLHALVLASEALWWLDHFQDARLAAEAALEIHPDSAQARWRRAVALYREADIMSTKEQLDAILEHVNRFAPAWNLRGQVKIWLDPERPEVAEADFAAAAELDPQNWVVPVRVSSEAFSQLVESAVDGFLQSEQGRIQAPNVVVEPLPARSDIAKGGDPDVRGAYFNPDNLGSSSPLGALGGDFASGARSDIIPGSRFTLYQRNIENLCPDADTLKVEIQASLSEEWASAMRVDLHATGGAAEHHSEHTAVPDDDPES